MHTILSFRYAFEGFVLALKEEPKLKIHLSTAVLVILSGLFFKISKDDWITLIIVMGLVISVELTNTAIEVVVDAFTDKSHPGAKLAKDISASAVLVVALTATIVGTIVFLPYISSQWIP